MQAQQSIFDYLTAEEGAVLRIATNLTAIKGQKKVQATYFSGTLESPKGDLFAANYRVRGRYRRRVAALPPLTIKFNKSELVAQRLTDSLRRVKIVLPALLNDEGDELLVREYLLYRMYEALSPHKYVRAQLVRVHLKDTGSKDTHEVHAILVEDEKETAHRLGGTIITEFGIPTNQWDQETAARTALFQYMIGNTDWDIAGQRNMRMIRVRQPHDTYLVMPYDFDFAGMVAAPYAVPASESGLKSVRDRFLMTNGVRPEALEDARKLFITRKKELYDVCRSKWLNRSAIRDMVSYLDSFFEAAEKNEPLPAKLILSKR